MANFIENLGFGFLAEDDETADAITAIVANEGKAINGYYGYPYINKHFGHVQFIMRTELNNEKGTFKMTGMDTHCAGFCVWKVRLTDIDLNPEDADKTEKRVVVSKPYTNGGMAPINIVNADVLPSFMQDDIIDLQVVAFPISFDYFADEDTYADSVTDEFMGKKLLLSEGHVLPSGLLINRNPNSENFEKNNWMDDHVMLRGEVKKLYIGKGKIGEEEFKAYISCIIDTEFGEIEIVHTYDQVKEEQRDKIRVGSMIAGVFVLSGDAAINEYENGIVLDREHNFSLLRYTLAKGAPERLRRVLAEDAVYVSEYNGETFSGADAIIERFKYIHEFGDKFYTHFATITEIDEGEEQLPYEEGTRCIIVARGEEEHYETIAFMDVNEEEYISRIYTSSNSRYRFQVDAPWKPEEEEF